MKIQPTAIEILSVLAPIAAARVSSAQARGRAKKYSYWGAVRYTIKLTRDGRLSAIAEECAGSDRRSKRLANVDCDDLCVREDRIRCYHIGTISQLQAAAILAQIPAADVDATRAKLAIDAATSRRSASSSLDGAMSPLLPLPTETMAYRPTLPLRAIELIHAI